MREIFEKFQAHLPFVRASLRWPGGDRALAVVNSIEELLETLMSKIIELDVRVEAIEESMRAIDLAHGRLTARVHTLELAVDQLVEDACHEQKT